MNRIARFATAGVLALSMLGVASAAQATQPVKTDVPCPGIAFPGYACYYDPAEHPDYAAQGYTYFFWWNDKGQFKSAPSGNPNR